VDAVNLRHEIGRGWSSTRNGPGDVDVPDAAVQSFALEAASRFAADLRAASSLSEMLRKVGKLISAAEALDLIVAARVKLDMERAAKEACQPFVIRWRNALKRSDLPATRRFVLVSLSLYAGNDGQGAWPSTRRLAADTALSRECVEQHLLGAEAAGWIRRDRTSRRASIAYELIIPVANLTSHSPVANLTSHSPVANGVGHSPVANLTERVANLTGRVANGVGQRDGKRLGETDSLRGEGSSHTCVRTHEDPAPDDAMEEF
jgi:hypothetical protein